MVSHGDDELLVIILITHDDVIKWKHFPRNWPFVRGIHRSPVNFPHKGQWRGAFMFSLICVWINGWVNNGEAGDLRRYRAHYDVIVMTIAPWNALKKTSKIRITGPVTDRIPSQTVSNADIFSMSWCHRGYQWFLDFPIEQPCLIKLHAGLAQHFINTSRMVYALCQNYKKILFWESKLL